MQGKLGKAVRICYGHATVMLFLECLRGVKSERSLSLLYISARDGVYTRGLSINSILVVAGTKLSLKQKNQWSFTVR